MSSRGSTGRSRPTTAMAQQPQQPSRQSSPPAYTVTKVGAHVDEAIQALFGHRVPPATLAKLAGGLPGARVRVFATPTHDNLSFDMRGPNDEYNGLRGLGQAPNGKLVMHNISFQVRPDLRGEGIAARMLATQTKAASRLGVRYLYTTAARRDSADPAEIVTGYRIWPRLGYNARIPASLRGQLPESLRGARTVRDLITTAHGRAWWREHGAGAKMYFNLKAGSRSRQMLLAELQQRGIRWRDL